MILVDTSVVIDYVRAKDARLQALLPTLPVAICGVTQRYCTEFGIRPIVATC
jgi:predicted nucleic acid-binding protein